jgi:hypothetical protein
MTMNDNPYKSPLTPSEASESGYVWAVAVMFFAGIGVGRCIIWIVKMIAQAS